MIDAELLSRRLSWGDAQALLRERLAFFPEEESAAAVELVVEGAVGGVGGLTKVDAGKLSLNGTATFAGPTRVVGGTVDFNLTSGTFTNGGAIGAAGRQSPPVGRESNAADRLAVAPQQGHLLGGGAVPDADRLVSPPRRQTFAISGEGHR